MLKRSWRWYLLVGVGLIGLVYGVLHAQSPHRACEQACRAVYYEAYLDCVAAARKTSEIAHCNVWYNAEVRECERACRR